MSRRHRMPLTPVFLFVALFIMITPVLADDEASEQEITAKIAHPRQFQDWYSQGDTKNIRGLANLQRASRTFSPCFCGLTSLKCCLRKRTLAKVEEAGNISVGNSF
ncbi:uncharacterized protein LOC110046693 [Orbicella faveolata]|uniref:uncharacterized protein LOC110046693 n=1 Tax=Orbicella faveolata TaxID=48498 RepID=UPI0009E19E2F|nr:uncharacterized protein LOC110046693 [Orbicella faveolata]